MTSVHWPWSVLDIAPTEDRKSIREAYSRLLKALDHEAETEAYMELRDARDAALSGQFLHAPAADEEDEDDFGLGDLFDEGTEPEATPPTVSEPEEKPVFTVAYSEEDDRRFQRVVDLFLQDDELAPADAEELGQHVDALFADERMADLGHYARVEGWLAQLLADRFPRGADLFPKVAEYFHWPERAHELGIHPAIPWLFNAHDGRSLVHELGTPGHAYHREWLELTSGKPKGPLWTRAVDKPRMANLIATVRRDYPWLEQEHWQPDLVARWEKKVERSGGVGGPNPWVWFVFVCIFFGALPQCSALDTKSLERDANPAMAAALEAENADQAVTAFLGRNFPEAVAKGRTLESLKAKSPAIYDKLHQRAKYLPDDQKNADNVLMKDLTDAYFMTVDKLPSDRQVADAKLRVAALKKLRKDPQGCVQFIVQPALYARSGNAPVILTEAYRNQIYTVLHDDYGTVKWAFAPNEFVLPGELVGKLIDRSGLSEKRVRAAVSARDSNDLDTCIVTTSLLELLTEIPRKQSEKILPVLL